MAENKYGVELISGITPKNNGSFPLVHAKDVEMPDGTRLSEQTTSNYPIEDGVSILEPDRYYVFGEVNSLSVNLSSVDDGKIHEYCFEFVPTEGFTQLAISPAPKWAGEPNITIGKTHQVSIMRGIGVMVCA